MAKKPDYDISGLQDPVKEKLADIENPQLITQNMGIYNGQQVEAVPLFDRTPGEKVISGFNNTWIVLGRDRPASRFSGAGGRGATQAGSIDIVVGRMGGAKEGPKSDIFVSPNFFTDSARIHISQKTNIDSNFALAEGTVGMKKNVAGIGIKADEVRMIGRTGVKIVTGQGRGIEAGRTGEKTGQGGNIDIVPSIDFIAGNDTEVSPSGIRKLQPLVKGDNLVECLRMMNKQINNLQAVVDNLFRNQSKFNAALMAHTHISTAPGLPVVPSVLVNLAGLQKTSRDLIKVLSPMVAHRVNSTFLEIIYLNRASEKFICSRHVNTT